MGWFKRFLRFQKRNIRKILIIDAALLIAAAGGIVAFSEPAPVKGLKVADSTYASALITWKDTEDADGYRVYRSEDGKNFEYLESTVGNSYRDKNLRTGTKYTYAVAARNGFKSSDISAKHSVNVVPSLTKPEVNIDTSKGSVELKISDVEGAIAYDIIRDGKTIARSEETVYVDEEAEADKPHEYEVKAVRYKKDPVYSEASAPASAELHMVPNITFTADSSDILISWDESEHFDQYKIYSGDQLLLETSETEYTLPDYSMDATYDIKLVGVNTEDQSQSPALEKRLRVFEEPMDNQGARQAACDWGVMIAEDDSFTYGTGNTAHHCGCYFCGTNRRKKAAGYEKTYCCNPFVHACYAHGAEDPQMLRTCQNGDSVGMEESDYTRYGTWERHSKSSELEMGDVLVGSHHVMLYIGDGQIVHAATEGWDADSICVDDVYSASRYYDFVMRYTGTGSGTMHKVREVDEKGQPIDTEETENKEDSEESESTEA